ncbi:MAG TPA: ribosome biogenesis GTPase Der [Candidatus Saccharimonadales bacterium]|jgi:GTP-binding protein|nr:ribosome biogenesis GTPase Der [Candidatus Saccharimonadales bacterium]
MSAIPIIAIVGRTNVGKSSLFNAVLGKRENIVAKEAGTTRDSITAIAHHNGKDFWIVDTAGVKDPADDFEITIQDQIEQAATSASVIVVVVEADVVAAEEDRKIATMALKTRQPVLLVVNKIDKIKDKNIDQFQRLGIKKIVTTSATQHSGISSMLDEIVSIIPRAKYKKADNRLHVAILGRPNVGKSQLFNTLAKKQQALVSARAGTTRDINRLTVRYKNREIELMDTAGIRRSGKIQVGVERFSVIRSLSAINQADICLLLIDMSELIVQLDKKIAGMIKEAGKGLVLVVSKIDLISEGELDQTQMIRQISGEYDFVPWAPVIFTSSITGLNVAQIFELVMDIDSHRQLRIPTPEINRWLSAAVNSFSPPSVKRVTPKLHYMIQETDNPTPSFKIFGRNTKQIHFSYRRFLERKLREQYDFSGSAVQLWFIEESRKQLSAAQVKET